MNAPLHPHPPAPAQPGVRSLVLIVTDEELVHLGLRTAFSACDWVSRTLLTTEPQIAAHIARTHQPHLAMIDSQIRGTSGLLLASKITQLAPSIRIVMMSGSDTQDVRPASHPDVHATISKSATLASIMETAKRALVEKPRARRAQSLQGGRPLLSDREVEVLEKLAVGLSNPEIAAVLHLSRHTVKQHTSAVYRKLGVRNRAQAASYAFQRGLVA